MLILFFALSEKTGSVFSFFFRCVVWNHFANVRDVAIKFLTDFYQDICRNVGTFSELGKGGRADFCLLSKLCFFSCLALRALPIIFYKIVSYLLLREILSPTWHEAVHMSVFLIFVIRYYIDSLCFKIYILRNDIQVINDDDLAITLVVNKISVAISLSVSRIILSPHF